MTSRSLHSIVIYKPDGVSVDHVKHWNNSIFPITCTNNEHKYMADDGSILDTKNYNFTVHKDSDNSEGGNKMYNAIPKGLSSSPYANNVNYPPDFSKPLVGWWYYVYGVSPTGDPDGSGNGPSPDQIATQLYSKTTKSNTVFNLASGAVPGTPGGGRIGCSQMAGDQNLFQPIPMKKCPSPDATGLCPNAAQEIGATFTVLNIGGWGNNPLAASIWTNSIVQQLINNVEDIVKYCKYYGYNIICLNIIAVLQSEMKDFGKQLNTLFSNLQSRNMGTMISFPGFGPFSAESMGGPYIADKSVDWFNDINSKNINRVSLEYYNKSRDTETGASINDAACNNGTGFSASCIQQNIPAVFLRHDPEKNILGLSCATPECTVGGSSLLKDSWIRSNFKGGVSVWRRKMYNYSDWSEHPYCPFEQ